MVPRWYQEADSGYIRVRGLRRRKEGNLSKVEFERINRKPDKVLKTD